MSAPPPLVLAVAQGRAADVAALLADLTLDAWETFVMPHMVTRDYQPPPRVVEVD